MRVCTEDTTLVGPHINPAGGDTLCVTKGTEIILDFIGAGRNPRVYAEPMRYYPQRWSSSETSLDNFLSFSIGPRGCLGRKFSTVEAVCFLTHLLRDWTVDIKLQEGESARDWEKRVMQPNIGITVNVGKCLHKAELPSVTENFPPRFQTTYRF